MSKIVLIDGHSILNRAFYGVPELTNSRGLHTNAVYGFLNIMFRVIEDEGADHLAVAFDLKDPTFRHKMFEGYKGTRKPMPEELHEQVPLIKEVLTAMRIPILSKSGYEADDILGTIAKRCAAEGADVAVVTGDRDLLQLADERIKIRMPRTSRNGTEVKDYFPEDVKREYQVTPKEYIDVKALMGDASDNIPGVPSIGEKTATSLIVAYGSIENAYAHVDEIKPPRAQKAMREHYDMAQMSKVLATICIDCEIGFSYEDAAIDNLYTPEAYQYMKQLEFKSLLQKFDSCARPPESGESVEAAFHTVQDGKEAKVVFEKALKAKDGVLSGIGAQLVIAHGSVIALALCFGEQDIYCLEAGGSLTGEYLADGLRRLCLSGTSVWTLDLKSQLPFLQPHEAAGAHGAVQPDQMSGGGRSSCEIQPDQMQGGGRSSCEIQPDQMPGGGRSSCEVQPDQMPGGMAQIDETSPVYDAGVAGYLLNPLKDTYDYDDLARDYLGMTVPSQADLIGRVSLETAFSSLPKEAQTCVCYMGYTAWKSKTALLDKLEAAGMKKLFFDIEMPVIYSLYHMEAEGICVRKKELFSYGEKLKVHIEDLEREICRDTGSEFNINSPKQLGEVLFDRMKLPYGKKTKTGYSTAADVLEKLAPEYPVVQKILDYRQYTKLKSTYADGLAACIREDGRIHGTFNQTITATGRISSTEPNLQNIPVRMELGREIRKVFVPQEGCVFVDADYSQIELRVLAHMSGDEHLIEAYKNAEDIHAITASEVFHVPLDQVTALQRRNAKAVNFGIVYGISAFGLSEGLSISRKEALEYISRYFETYPQVKHFLDGLVREGKENGWVTTMFGRRRPVPELKSANFMQRSFGERVAMNSPIQGTAADIIKIAMIRVDQRLRKEGLRSRLVLQIHDELLIEAWKEELDRVKTVLSEEMRNAAHLRVALEIDLKTGDSWFETK